MKTEKEALKEIAYLISPEHFAELKARYILRPWPYVVGEIESVLEDIKDDDKSNATQIKRCVCPFCDQPHDPKLDTI